MEATERMNVLTLADTYRRLAEVVINDRLSWEAAWRLHRRVWSGMYRKSGLELPGALLSSALRMERLGGTTAEAARLFAESAELYRTEAINPG